MGVLVRAQCGRAAGRLAARSTPAYLTNLEVVVDRGGALGAACDFDRASAARLSTKPLSVTMPLYLFEPMQAQGVAAAARRTQDG